MIIPKITIYHCSISLSNNKYFKRLNKFLSKYILKIHTWTTWFSNRVDFLKESNKNKSVLLFEDGMILFSVC